MIEAARSAAGPNAVQCDHCRLTVPRHLIDPGAEYQYCCAGCRAVAAAIRGAGLDRYYALAAEEPPPGAPATTTDRDYAAYDEQTFMTLYVVGDGHGPSSTELALEGLHCAACVWLIERLPSIEPGLLEARVDFGRRRVRLRWDADRVRLSRLGRRLDALGYPSHPYREDERVGLRRLEERRHLVRVGVAGAIAGNVMLMAFALYGGMLGGMEPAHERFFRWSALGLTLLALVWPGRVFFRGALSSLRAGMLHMDVPVALALIAGTAWGAANTVRGTGEIYFESLTAVVFLLLVGRWLQFRRQRAAQDAVEQLYRVTPAVARRLDEHGTPREVPVEALEPGHEVEVRAGEAVPADGTVVRGDSSVDLSLLTGESRPVDAGVGDLVHAGTVNLGAPLIVRIETTGERTRVGRLMALVEELARDRPPVVRLADRVAHWFVIVVLVWAAATLLLWLALDRSQALEHTIALLIVTCPCALGLATPLAVVAAVGRAARRGILIKGGETLERLARPGLAILDKTGTLTRGRMGVVRWSGAAEHGPWIAAAEAGVAHPIAEALHESLSGEAGLPGPVRSRQLAGSGVRAEIDGRSVLVGSPHWIDSELGSIPERASRDVESCVADGLTPVVAVIEGRIVGVAGLGDPLLDEAKAAVGALRDAGWRVRLLSGDHPRLVDAVAQSVGIETDACEGGASPERKAEVALAAGREYDTVVMVGDGVNDAAAMSAASVGVAVHGGAEPSLAVSDVYMRRSGLVPLVELFLGAPRAMGVIRRNIVFSLAYNLLTGTLATAGMIDPLVAAVLMPLSSLTVLTLSYRSRTFSVERLPPTGAS